ncbi:MAG: hypothetical protein CJBNEKGG_04011 [Prosthecobacter sp.]|nr:hypothetical protein [Prosthecobacter sp.]
MFNYAHGTEVTLTAPSTAPNGNIFLHWEKNGLPLATTQSVTVLMDGNHQMSIIYGAPTVTPAYTVSLASEPIAGGVVTGGGSFGSGALVSAHAVPNTGYRFVNWTAAGQVFSLSPDPSFQVTGNMSLVANFAPATGTHTIATSSNPMAGGTTSGAGSYSNGQIVTLNATPADGWLFGTWTENGTVIGFTSSLVFPAYQSRDLLATFTPDFSKNYYLSITSENGTAIRTPNQTAYTPGSTVSVKATPAVGYYFSGWSGAAAGTENPLTVTMTANKSLIANFTAAPPNTYTLSVNTSTRGAVSKSPDQAFYNAGSVVTLTATPTAGNSFAGWRRGAFGITNPVQVTMDADKLIAPNFIPTSPGSSRLTISTPFAVNVGYQAGDNSSAYYSVSNTGSGTMYYHGTATVNWLQVNSGGTPVSGGGSSGLAISWEENTSSSPRTGEVWVYAPGAQNSPQIYTITQAAGVPKFALTVEAVNGAVTRTPDAATYSSGSSVVLSANPIAGYAFAGWAGDASGTLNPLTVVMAAPRSITATFARLPAPDLKLEFNLASNTAIAGLNVVVTGMIKNFGADSSAACRTYFRLSSSATVPPSITVGETPFIEVGALAVGAQQSIASTVEFDAKLAAGTYYVWALVDPELSGNEQSTARTNNHAVTSVLVVPDTTPPAISFTSPATPVALATSTALGLAGSASDNVGVTQVTWVNNRGGSGTAIGTTAWSIVGVTLADGENVINVTAADAEGNYSTNMVTVVNYLADQTPPSVNISFPTALGTTDVERGEISLGGQANDDGSSLASVSWSNDRGGGGTCLGKETWTVADVRLLPGVNTITITAMDRAGNQGTASLAVTANIVPASTDPNRPSIAITAPAVNGRVEVGGFTVSGTASAKMGVQSILYKLDDGPWKEHLVGVASKTSWSISPPSPTYGTHAIYVRSKDAEGHLSLISSRTFVFVIRSNLILTVNGPGTVKYGGFTNTTGLEIGKNYTLTAKPNAGAIFAGWSGGVVSAVPAITFTMQEGLEVTATFVDNPFSTVAGAYLGLARGETDDHATSGLLRSTVTKAGSFSGTLLLGGKSHRLNGKFDSNGQWVGQITRSKQVPLSLLLMLDVAGGSDTLTGLVSDGTVTAAIQTDRATYNAKTNAAPSMGRYTFVIEPEVGDATAPSGFGVGTLVVDGAGKVTLTGKLAETTGLSMTSQVAKDGRWPLHVLLYSSTGSFTGEMLFADLSERDASGGVFWFKPVRTKDSYFKNGFSTQPSLVAQRYAPSAKGVRILTDWDASSGAGLLTADSADLPSALSQPVTWTTANLIQSDQTILPGLKVTTVVSTGLFSGSFLHPTTHKSMTFSGVLLQNTQEGLGWFQGTTSTGLVILKKAPAP